MPWQSMRSFRRRTASTSFWRSEPAAALRGLAKGLPPSFWRCSLTSAKSSTAINTSPRTSNRSGMGNSSVAVSVCGTSWMTLAFSVTSSPMRPSPRVAARSNTPLRYTRANDRPSILSSVTYSGASTRCNHSSSSSSSKTLSRLSMRSRCSTFSNDDSTGAPTCWVGLSGVASSG